MTRFLLLVFAALSLAGCLPFSCTRTESRAVTAADSLSKRLAAGIVPDTLQRKGTLTGPVDAALEYPRTVFFGADGLTYVGDTRRNSVFVFSQEGVAVREMSWIDADVPYLAGQRGDTLVVFSPARSRFDFMVDGRLSRKVPIPGGAPLGALQYAAASGTDLYLKVVAKEGEGYVVRIGQGGQVRARRPLTGSQWRHAGMLRIWGDSLLSLSGFYPTIDLLPLSLAGPADSLELRGFDSPILHRTRAFGSGAARGAPLLSSSAAALASALFVLNMRPGWVRVDVYDQAGKLCHILLDGEPLLNKQFYPIDIAVRPDGGGIEIAVAVLEPSPEVRLYTWPGGNCYEDA